jgi:secondary thiamine-phosphate synthase enzyme
VPKIVLTVPTEHPVHLVDVTREVQRALEALGVREGTCTAFAPHTTAAVTINENADPDVCHDLVLGLADVVRDLPGFRHAEGNSAAHLKSSLVGCSVTVPVEGGRLQLGRWQSIFFCEFDGPRTRSLWVTATGER